MDEMRTYAVGDIHGMIGPLRRALDWIKKDANGTPYRVVFVGDYVDRGENSRSVVDLIRSMPSHWVALKGNHEDMMADAVLNNDNVDFWDRNGGPATRRNYPDTSEGRAALRADATFLSKLPLSYDDGVRFFCHAGIDPNRPLNDQNPNVLIWDRTWYGQKIGNVVDPGRLVVHGHTPTSVGPSGTRNSINIDTGAVFGYTLTVACWPDPMSRRCTTKMFPAEQLTV